MLNKDNFLNSLRSLRNYRLHNIASAYPKFYFTLVIAAAMAGYGFILLFPLLGMVALSQLLEVANEFTVNTVSEALIWVGVFIFSVAISHHILTVKFELPKGVALPKVPQLFEIIENTKTETFWRKIFHPRFENVLLSEQYELEIQKTPVNGIPLWSKNTLIIGFPVMQTMAPDYFECALQRKLLQYSKGRNIVTNWIFQLREIWLLYPKAFSQRKLLGEQLIVWFFKWYAPLFKKLSLHTAQQDGLAADTMMLREVNDSDLFKSIQNHTIGQYFFHKAYMPMFVNRIKTKGEHPAKLNPYTALPVVFRKTVDEQRCLQLLAEFIKNPLNTGSAVPSFSQRMRNIGQTKIRLPKLGQLSAAEHYFGVHYSKAAQIMDNVWRNKINFQLKQQLPKSTASTPSRIRMKLLAG